MLLRWARPERCLGAPQPTICEDRTVLRTVEITAELTVPLRGEVFHNLHWQKKLDLSLDCFTCERSEAHYSLPIWRGMRGLFR